MFKSKYQRIPKQVFITTRFPLSDMLQSHFNHIRSKNLDYDIVVYSDDEVREYISSNWGPFVLGLYDCIGVEYFPAKIDLWRYLIIYDRGGVYFDDKSGPVRSLDSLIKPDDKMIISTWGENISLWKKEYSHKKGEFTNWCVVAEPRHPIIQSIITDIVNRIIRSNGTERGKDGVLRMTGPIGTTTTILNNLGKYKDSVKVMKNSFNRKMYFNAITKSRKFSKHHESMRENDRLYSTQETPIVDVGSVKSLLDEFANINVPVPDEFIFSYLNDDSPL